MLPVSDRMKFYLGSLVGLVGLVKIGRELLLEHWRGLQVVVQQAQELPGSELSWHYLSDLELC